MNDFFKDRFDDISEIIDIVKYGMSMGVNGFIYSSELSDIYNEYKDQIEDLLDVTDIKYTDLIPNFGTLQQVKEAAVWFAVEHWCEGVLEAHQEQEQENQWKEEQEEQQGLNNELLASALA